VAETPKYPKEKQFDASPSRPTGKDIYGVKNIAEAGQEAKGWGKDGAWKNR